MTEKQFLELLPVVSKTGRIRWKVLPNGEIRTASGYNILTGFYRGMRRGQINGHHVDTYGAANVLELLSVFKRLLKAAKGLTGHDQRLRARLLKATGAKPEQ